MRLERSVQSFGGGRQSGTVALAEALSLPGLKFCTLPPAGTTILAEFFTPQILLPGGMRTAIKNDAL
jgi:hypothetical protein